MLLTFLILIVLKRDPDPGNGLIPEVGRASTGSGRVSLGALRALEYLGTTLSKTIHPPLISVTYGFTVSVQMCKIPIQKT